MIKVNGKGYTEKYIQQAVAALEAAGVRDEGFDNGEVCLSAMTEKGEIRVSIAPDQYHSVLVDLTANAEQCRALNITAELPNDFDMILLPLATIEIPDAEIDEMYVLEEGKNAGCPRIFLYDKMENDCTHIVLMDGTGMKVMEN